MVQFSAHPTISSDSLDHHAALTHRRTSLHPPRDGLITGAPRLGLLVRRLPCVISVFGAVEFHVLSIPCWNMGFCISY